MWKNLEHIELTFDFFRARGEDKFHCGIRGKTLIWVKEKEMHSSYKLLYIVCQIAQFLG